MTPRKHLVLVALWLLGPHVALAKGTDAQEREARTACLAGDVAKGVTILSDLFVSTKDPSFIYSQGRCLEQNHRYEDAIARFQDYLRVGHKLGKADRAEAQKHITDCEDLLARQRVQQPPAAALESKEAKERAAKKACLNGEPSQGIKVLTDLYVDTNDPTYIYNQGRCYEQNNLCEEAIVRFREYLRKTPNRDEGDRSEVAKHIADCEALLAKKGAGGATPPTLTAEPSTASAARTPEAVVALPSSSEAVRPGAGLRTAGVLTMAAGGAFAIAGLVLNLQHNSKVNSLQGDYSNQGADSAQRYKTLSIVGYGAGAAAVAGGAVLYWLGRREGNTVVVPTAVAGNAGLLLRGSF